MNITFTFVAGTAVGAVIGAILIFAGTMLSTFITRKSEERRQIRELGLRVALAKFEQQVALAKQVANAKGEAVFMPPFEQHLTYGIKLAEAVSSKRRSAEQIGRIIAESIRFSEAVTEAIREETTRQK